MVRTVLDLRLRSTMHQLRREWWRVLMLVVGVVWSISLVPAVVWGARVLSYNTVAVKADAAVAVTVILTLGWWLVPLAITGLDDTLEPTRFASLGIAPRRLAPALSVSTLLTVPSLFTLFVLVALSTMWHNEHPRTLVLVVAVAGAVVQWVAVVWSSRVVSAWTARIVAGRRSRLALAGTVGAVVLLAIPVVWVVARDGLEMVLDYDIPVLLDQWGRTPLAAAMAAPESLALRNTWGVLWRLAITLGWAAALQGAWAANVAYAQVHPLFRGGGTRERDDAVLAAATPDARGRWRAAWHAVWRRVWPVARHAHGPVRAVRARQERAWRSDPRHVAALAGVVVMPLMVLVLVPLFGVDSRWMLLAPLVLAASIGWGRHNDLALDSTAVWLDVVSGRHGRAVMSGRMAAVLRWALPLVVIMALLAWGWSRQWLLGLGILGTSLGVLGATLGVSAVTAVVFPYRVAAPGESPLGAPPGSVGASVVAQTLSSLATAVVVPVVMAPMAAAVLWDARWAWVAAVVGVVIGGAMYVGGVRFAGMMYDQRAGALVGALS